MLLARLVARLRDGHRANFSKHALRGKKFAGVTSAKDERFATGVRDAHRQVRHQCIKHVVAASLISRS